MLSTLAAIAKCSVRLVYFVFFQTSRFSRYLATISPSLEPGTCLIDLPSAEFSNRSMQVLLWAQLMTNGVLVALVSTAVLVLARIPPTDIFFGVAVGVGGVLVGGFASAWCIGFGPSIQSSTLAGSISAIGFGLAGTGSISIIFASNTLGAVALLAGAGFACGGIANVAQFPDEIEPRTFLGQIAVCVISFAVTLVVYGGLFLLIAGVFDKGIESPFFAIAWALPTSLALGPVLDWKTKRRKKSWAFALLVAVLSIGLSLVAFLLDYPAVRNPALQTIRGLSIGGADGLLIAAGYIFPFTVARGLGSRVAAGVASAMSIGAVLTVYTIGVLGMDPVLMICTVLIALTLGLSFSILRALLFVPIWAVWNTILLAQDKSRESARLLKWNSSFLDELQFGRQVGIVEHLALAMKHNTTLAEQAEKQLLAGPQNWAVEAAHDEYALHRIEDCKNVQDVAAISIPSASNEFVDGILRISKDIQVALRQMSSFRRRLTLETVESNLATLHRGLRGNRRYRNRLSKVCAKWRTFLHDQIALENEAIVNRQEIVNPYVATPILEEATTFVGRVEVAAKIERLILDARRQPLFLLGQRRIGKTSLLNNLGRLLPSSIIPMYVDLQGPISKSEDQSEFLYFLALNLADSLRRLRNIDHPSPSWDDFKENSFVVYEDWFSRLEGRFPDRSFLIQLDEAEALVEVENEYVQKVIFQHLRHLIQHRKQVRLLLASSHHIEELAGWSRFLVNVRRIELSYLDVADARNLIENPIDGFDLLYTNDSVDELCRLTSCHPALLQLMCATIVDRRNENQTPSRSAVTVDEVERAIPQAIEEGSALYFLDIATVAGESGRKILNCVAKNRSASLAELTDKFPDIDINHELEKLRRRQILAGHEHVRFEVELVRIRFELTSSGAL